ncbi:F-box only protein 7 isoform X1 [Nerophis lumbriciformis]|uniref:F-box only protein 7 isoform X1 n=2 Tax=Nerophis lumbriciformis TaxID=546530 RepID=UPI002AE03EAB|nr:F-box only protein 7 isoform X1 [Nerophis lumbriciformis]
MLLAEEDKTQKRRACRPIVRMKLRVRIYKQTNKVDLFGPESTIKELTEHIQNVLLPSHGLGQDVVFGLSLSGAELLTDTSQTLSSCGVVPGDLIRVLLPAVNASPENGDSAWTPLAEPTAMTSSGSCRPATPDPSEPSGSCGPRAPPVLSWEPMLCGEAGEGQAPRSLELLYHNACVTTPNDAIMVAAHLLMLETGFTPQGSEVKSAQMPSGWRSEGGAYRLQYTHPLCERGVVTVVAVRMSPVLVIEAILQVADSASMAAKVCVDPSSYVTEAWSGASAAAAFTALSRLSRVFKDQLVYPLIAATREALSLPVAFGLAALPPELLLLVLRLLDVRSLVRLSAVCKYLHASTEDPALWRHLVRRDFSDHNWQGETNWKELYKSFYKFRHKRGCVDRPCSLPLIHRQIFSPVPPPYSPLPGIIGGAYDQRPAIPYGVLPTPRYDPIGPPLHGPLHSERRRRRSDPRPPPGSVRPADVRRGFI